MRSRSRPRAGHRVGSPVLFRTVGGSLGDGPRRDGPGPRGAGVPTPAPRTHRTAPHRCVPDHGSAGPDSDSCRPPTGTKRRSRCRPSASVSSRSRSATRSHDAPRPARDRPGAEAWPHPSPAPRRPLPRRKSRPGSGSSTPTSSARPRREPSTTASVSCASAFTRPAADVRRSRPATTARSGLRRAFAPVGPGYQTFVGRLAQRIGTRARHRPGDPDEGRPPDLRPEPTSPRPADRPSAEHAYLPGSGAASSPREMHAGAARGRSTSGRRRRQLRRSTERSPRASGRVTTSGWRQRVGDSRLATTSRRGGPTRPTPASS